MTRQKLKARDVFEQLARGPFELEIERRWLPRSLPREVHEVRRSEITQYYVRIGSPEEGRLRLRRKGDEFLASIKMGNGLVRRESLPLSLSETDFHDILDGKPWPRVQKVRCYIGHDGHVMDLDIYRGSLTGLAIAETEFPSVKRADRFAVPLWLGREVTWIWGLGNSALARYGMPANVELLTEAVKPLLRTFERGDNAQAKPRS